ncbi:MAG: GTPase ObgE [Armatimonadota bacterium]|nr:MAG: GTPase ObgE [Armatimonadota bacterium]
MLVDEAKVFVQAGDGGNGATSFRRERHVPRGGPDGGDGGSGGDVWVRANAKVRTLVDFLRKSHFRAQRGGHGAGANKTGERGADVEIMVPAGTVMYDANTGAQLADLAQPGDACLAARGGRGGRGNARFATAVRRTPRFAEKGEPGERRWLRLELKLLADVGIIGMPNAGKSTLLSRMSAAKPKIADYPFTTLAPNLGVAHTPEGKSFIVADLPGLVEGAHAGRGRGHDFLRHIERTRLLVHVVDLAADGRDPHDDFRVVNEELKAYPADLSRLPHLVAANKLDLPAAAERLDSFTRALRDAGFEVLPISAVTGDGVAELVYRCADLVEELAPAEENVEPRVFVPTPEAEPLNVERVGDGLYAVTGSAVEKLIARTDLDSDDAVGSIQSRLERMGVVERLRDLGAKHGDKVLIGEQQFDFLD